MKTVYFLSLLILTSCVSAPKFQQKDSQGIGYSIQPGSMTNFFVAEAVLSTNSVDDKFIERYLYRAIGETCEQKGFKFFDTSEIAIVTDEKFKRANKDGYCFETNTRRALGLTFKIAPQNTFRATLQIESVNKKPDTLATPGDLVLELDGTPLTSVRQLKSIMYANSQKPKFQMTIVRDSKKMVIEEPITNFVNGHLGPKDLDFFRKMVP